MTRTVFYCRCGARLVGSERLEHDCETPGRLPPLSPELDPIADPREKTTAPDDPDSGDDDLPFDAIGPDPDAENDPSLRDLETVCAWCGVEHWRESSSRDCDCKRHIDGATEKYECNAAFPDAAPPAPQRGASWAGGELEGR